MPILFSILLSETNFTQLLKIKIIPTIGQSKQNDYCSIHFKHLEFIKCNVDYLDNMKIELRRLVGDLIEFDNENRVVLNIVIKNPI